MSAARFIIGDTRDVTAAMPDGSVDLVLTSPPFLALRSYLPADHPDKGREIGSEATPAEFLQVLLDLTADWRRVLAPHGSICVELGDTYSGSGGAGGDYAEGGLRDGQPAFRGTAARRTIRPNGDANHRDVSGVANLGGPGWPLQKSLCGIPHLYHLSLAYGRNLLTGQDSPAGQWRVRNVVAWCRPNPPVGALGDKFRPATSYLTIATPYRDRYFDLDAVRTEPKYHDDFRPQESAGYRGITEGGARSVHTPAHPAGAPPLDWWEVPTHPYKGAHYATWPEALCDRPVLAMVPPKVCTTCGVPSRRIAEPTDEYREHMGKDIYASDVPRDVRGMQPRNGAHARISRENVTIGWTDCGHDSWRRGIVLDPFAGSGTTLKVATAHGRDAIGIDIDERNADLAQQRVGMFLTVERAIDTEATVA